MKAMDTRINVLAPLEASSLHICHYALENTEQKTTRVFHRYSGMSSNKVMVLSDVTRRWYIGRRKRRSLSQQSHKHNKFIGSLPVPINNGLIWNMAISSCSCCTRELTFSIFGTSQWHQKRVQLCCSAALHLPTQLTHTWWICICGGQRTRRHGSPPSRASRRMHSRCRPCSQRRRMSAWSQTYPIVHSSSTGSNHIQRNRLILRIGTTCISKGRKNSKRVSTASIWRGSYLSVYILQTP